MRQKGRAARRRAREARPRAKARPTPPTRATDPGAFVANLAAAAERGEALGYFARHTLDGAACAKWGPEIKKLFGVAIDSPELLDLGVMQWPWAILRQRQAAWSIALKAAALLERQRDERRELFAGYMEAAAAVKRYFPAGGPAPGTVGHDPWRAMYEKWEADEEALIAYLRKVADAPGPIRSGPAPDIALANVAHAVSEWTKQHGRTGKADWQATVKIMRCHGWDLGRLDVERTAVQLKDRVRRARRRGTVTLTREGTVPSPQ